MNKTKERHDKEGAVMLLVLVMSTFIFLLGIGRLMYFREQCRRRFERQWQIHEEMATKSSMMYIKDIVADPTRAPFGSLPGRNQFTQNSNIQTTLQYSVSRLGRTISAEVCPVEPLLYEEFTNALSSSVYEVWEDGQGGGSGNGEHTVDTGDGGKGIYSTKDTNSIYDRVLSSFSITNSWLDAEFGLLYVWMLKEKGSSGGGSADDIWNMQFFITGYPSPLFSPQLGDIQTNSTMIFQYIKNDEATGFHLVMNDVGATNRLWFHDASYTRTESLYDGLGEAYGTFATVLSGDHVTLMRESAGQEVFKSYDTITNVSFLTDFANTTVGIGGINVTNVTDLSQEIEIDWLMIRDPFDYEIFLVRDLKNDGCLQTNRSTVVDLVYDSGWYPSFDVYDTFPAE